MQSTLLLSLGPSPSHAQTRYLLLPGSKAAELLGWSPRLAGLDGFREGLSRTVDWFSDPVNLARYRPDAYTT